MTDHSRRPRPPARPDKLEPERQPEHVWTEEEIDEAIAETFPASDPPAFHKVGYSAPRP